MTDEPLHRRRWGAGSRTAVLLHGSTSSSNTWWHVASELANRGWAVEAFDLPSHGASAALQRPLTPSAAAAGVRDAIGTRTIDVLVGHSFGAAVAATLVADAPATAHFLVLEELPGPASVAWSDEAGAVLSAAAGARADRLGAISRTRSDQPRWQDEDCEHAVDDLARCHPPDVAAGLSFGADWLPLSTMRRITRPVLLLLAPDAAGMNRLEDATALRGADRRRVQDALGADTRLLDGGHCLHRDDPHGWLHHVHSTSR